MSITDRLAAAEKKKQELVIVEPLSAQDRKDWKRYREEVSVHQDVVCSFVDLLAEIRDRRLYREEYGTFEAYVDAELTFSKRHIDRLIHHNEVKGILGPNGPKITEAESRELTDVPPEKIPGVIKKADAKAKKEGRKRTAADVKAVAAKEADADTEPEYEEVEEELSQAEQAVENAAALTEIVRQLQAAKRLAKAIKEVPGHEIFVSVELDIQRKIDTAIGAVKVTIPHAVCPRCNGETCVQCGNHGWVNSVLFKSLEKASV